MRISAFFAIVFYSGVMLNQSVHAESFSLIDTGEFFKTQYLSLCQNAMNDGDSDTSCSLQNISFNPEIIGSSRSCINTNSTGSSNENIKIELEIASDGISSYNKVIFNSVSVNCAGETDIEVFSNQEWQHLGELQPSQAPYVIGSLCFDVACRNMDFEIQSICAYGGIPNANECSDKSDLTVGVFPLQSGNVTSNPSGIDCDSNCTAAFDRSASVTLEATPSPGYTFLEWWPGDCNGNNPVCTLTMDQARSVRANFQQIGTTSYQLTLERNGNGTVSSSPEGISCGNGSDCQAYFEEGATVSLQAYPGVGFRFAGWGGSCSGTMESCTVIMNQAHTVTAHFESASGGGDTHTLNVTKNGSGTVTSSPSGINCGSSCQASFEEDSYVTLTATPSSGWLFKRWGQGCSGSSGNTCSIKISQNRNASVYFEQIGGGGPAHTLNVIKNGSGAVTSSPSGINCGSSCQASFEEDSFVTLTATPSSGWRLKRWGQGCSGSSGNTCSIKISQNRNASVYFEQIGGGGPVHTLNVIKNGSGAVTSSPSGINCGGSCQASFDEDSYVTLTATPSSGWRLKRWGQGCSGSSGNTCSIKISQNRNASVYFEQIGGGGPVHTLNVIKNGSGTVTSSPSGINCGSSCQASFDEDSYVTLTATPSSGWRLKRWGQGCSGSSGNTCSIKISQNRNASVYFEQIGGGGPTHTLNVIKNGSGSVTSSPSGINCGSSCQASFDEDSYVTLTATPSSGWRFKRWGQGCTGSSGNTCRIKISQNRNASVYFEKIRITKITAGFSHSCALTDRNEIYCWGSNDWGQLGDGTRLDRLEPVKVGMINDHIVSLSAGSTHTCAMSYSDVYCWGYNFNGQLGDGTRVDRLTPVKVTHFNNSLRSISAGRFHTCALTNNGDVYCWGLNREGQLGNGTTQESSFPIFTGITDGISVSAGSNHTCAVSNNGGTVYCWGSNYAGQLGDGTTVNHSIPVPVSINSPMNTVSSGWGHTCAKGNGDIFCWGDNNGGQIGNGTTSFSEKSPVNVLSATYIPYVIAGGGHTCATNVGGSFFCWGRNNYGQLGNGTRTDSWLPTIMNYSFSTLSLGSFHTCGLTEGEARCWGANDTGQLGDGTTTDRLFPIQVNINEKLDVIFVGSFE